MQRFAHQELRQAYRLAHRQEFMNMFSYHLPFVAIITNFAPVNCSKCHKTWFIMQELYPNE